MNLPHVHLLLNHWPIIGELIALGLLVVAMIARSEDLKHATLALFGILAILVIPVYLSGNAAADAIKQIPEINAQMMDTHEGAAVIAFLGMEITGALALIGLWPFARKRSSGAAWSTYAVLIFAIATAGMMAVAGNTGGDIRHPEIHQDPGTAGFAATGVQLILAARHFVVDSSRWIWPVLEDLHFMGLIMIVGSVCLLNLRILGFLKRLPVGPLHRLIPIGLVGFAINIVTGFFFFFGMPFFYVTNFVFQYKILFIVLAAANLVVFHCTSVFNKWKDIGADQDAPAFAKLVAASSIILWLAVIIIGRYIPLGEGG